MLECSRRHPRPASWTIVLFLAALVLPSTARTQGYGSVRGVVVDSMGGAVGSAQIAVADRNLRVETNAAGEFRLAQVPAGELRFAVRRLGYKPSIFVVQVAPGVETAVSFSLSALAEMLPPVEVTRRPEISDRRLAGFNARVEKGIGHFITRDVLDRRDSPRFADVLRMVPGLRVRPLRGRGGGGTTVSMRGNCSPLVFFDGFPAAAGPVDLDMIDLASVEGIEVYSGISSVPPEFYSVSGGERCGVIAVWSRPAGPRRRRLGAARPGELERELATKEVYTAAEVEQTALLAPGTAQPTYPDTLWRAGVGGRVVAEFIVGADGSIEAGTFGIASTTHPYFSAAVKAALEGAVFRPARLAARNVRQLVRIPFVFDPLSRAPSEGREP